MLTYQHRASAPSQMNGDTAGTTVYMDVHHPTVCIHQLSQLMLATILRHNISNFVTFSETVWTCKCMEPIVEMQDQVSKQFLKIYHEYMKYTKLLNLDNFKKCSRNPTFHFQHWTTQQM
jgi:phospholipase/lecithinase/hemolysin